jgi:hypothetical protein
MTVAEKIEKQAEPRAGNYEVARFNALRHGVLSQYTALPWEDRAEYDALLEALVAEHNPQGPTEEHLVEELAGIIWRKRRLRLGEYAAHHRALNRATDPLQETANAALVHVPEHVEIVSIDNAIRATEEQTAEALAFVENNQAITEKVLGLLKRPSATAYSRALAKLPDDIRAGWEERLEEQPASEPDDRDEDETPYCADAESLRRFLEGEVLPWYRKRHRELEHRPLIRTQAFGEAVDPHRLEQLARYEVHLDRKLERTVAMLLKLQELRRAANPA